MSFILEQGGGGGPVTPSVRNATAMNFEIEGGGTTVMFKNAVTGNIVATAPANVLSAVAYGAGIKVEYIGGDTAFITELNNPTIQIAGTLLIGSVVANAGDLNALFANAGGGVAPTITSGNINIPTGGNGIVYQTQVWSHKQVILVN